MAEAPDARVLDRLFVTVESRRGADPGQSYTAKLLARGPRKAAQKLGEEAVEAALEAVAGDPAGLTAESADLLYHLCVVWAACGLRPEQVWAELARREGVGGLAEKASRGKEESGDGL